MIDIVTLNKARMMVCSKLSEEERAEFVEEADRWIAEGSDPMSKRECVLSTFEVLAPTEHSHCDRKTSPWLDRLVFLASVGSDQRHGPHHDVLCR